MKSCTRPPPQLPKLSPAFNDLLSRCLAKDPSSRISLSEVIRHPFWDVKFPALHLPDQPSVASSGHAVDVMRLSRAMVRPAFPARFWLPLHFPRHAGCPCISRAMLAAGRYVT